MMNIDGRSGGAEDRSHQDKRPEGSHGRPSEPRTGRGEPAGKPEEADQVSGENVGGEKDAETGELKWKEDIKKRTGGG